MGFEKMGSGHSLRFVASASDPRNRLGWRSVLVDLPRIGATRSGYTHCRQAPRGSRPGFPFRTTFPAMSVPTSLRTGRSEVPVDDPTFG
jgi:hypothetical protein